MTYWEEGKGGWEIEKPTTTEQKCPCKSTTKREVRQEKETETSQSQKKERKKETVRQGKAGNSPKNAKKQETGRPRGTLSRALELRRDRTSPWWSWKVCDFDVTGSCDVISPDHFVRGFYYSSFRRCGLNFLVLQKNNKIFAHNLSIHKKLEQSTHWNILKNGANILLLVAVAL